MVRSFAAVLIVTFSLANSGCRSCSSCHDYDRPVADCECGTCCGRAGSAFTGCSDGGCTTSGCDSCEGGPSGCNSCGSYNGYVEGPPVVDGAYE